MNIYRHISANQSLLEPYPFFSEISMEAYLCENPNILTLDQYNYTQPLILEYELALKEGRGADSNGRIDILAQYAENETLAVIELKKGVLTEDHLNQLQDYLRAKNQLLEKFPKIGNTHDADQSWIGVLVGSHIAPSLQTLLESGSGYKFDGIPIAALTLQRYRETRTNEIFVIADVIFKQSARDTSKYYFKNEFYGKGRLVLEVIKDFVDRNKAIGYSALLEAFPKELQGTYGAFDVLSSLERNGEGAGLERSRYFQKADEVIRIAENLEIVVCSQWGKGNIERFIERARELGFDIN